MKTVAVIIACGIMIVSCTPRGVIETQPSVGKEVYVNPLWEDYLKEGE